MALSFSPFVILAALLAVALVTLVTYGIVRVISKDSKN